MGHIVSQLTLTGTLGMDGHALREATSPEDESTGSGCIPESLSNGTHFCTLFIAKGSEAAHIDLQLFKASGGPKATATQSPDL